MTTPITPADAEIQLSEVSSQMSDGIRILKALRDSPDAVCASACRALQDAQDHLEDVIQAVIDGQAGGAW